jgi:hypothetical protein
VTVRLEVKEYEGGYSTYRATPEDLDGHFTVSFGSAHAYNDRRPVVTVSAQQSGFDAHLVSDDVELISALRGLVGRGSWDAAAVVAVETLVWERILRGTSPEDIRRAMARVYDAGHEDGRAELRAELRDLLGVRGPGR